MREWINDKVYYDDKNLRIDNIKLQYESEHCIRDYGIEGYKRKKTHLNSPAVVNVHSVNCKNYKWWI